MSSRQELADRALACLKAIDQGALTAGYVDESWQDVWAGNVKFRTADGWEFTIFNDCDSWDYVDSFKSPDGSVMDFDEMQQFGELANHTPESNWFERARRCEP